MDLTRGSMRSTLSATTELPSATPLHWPRATVHSSVSVTQTNFSLSSSQSSTAAVTSSSSSATINRPFFQDPTSVTPPPSASNRQGPSLPKAALEYVLIATFSIIFVGLLIQRFVYRRRNNTSFWPSRQSAPSPDHDAPALPQRFPRTIGLIGVPPYSYSRRTHALDTDAAGRRILSGIDNSDHDGYIWDKDVLPAYDVSGGPPKYREVALELDIMPTTQNINTASENSSRTGNTAADDASEMRDSHPLSGSGHRDDDVIGNLAVPPAVYVRH